MERVQATAWNKRPVCYLNCPEALSRAAIICIICCHIGSIEMGWCPSPKMSGFGHCRIQGKFPRNGVEKQVVIRYDPVSAHDHGLQVLLSGEIAFHIR